MDRDWTANATRLAHSTRIRRAYALALACCAGLACAGIVAWFLQARPGAAAPPVGGDPISISAPARIGDETVRALATADFDLDRRSDAAYATGQRLRLMANRSTTDSLAWPVSVTIATFEAALTALAAADIDGDALPDLAAAAAGRLRLLRNPGLPFSAAWTVSQSLTSTSPSSVTAMAAGDLDRDGDVDIVTAGQNGQIVAWANPGRATAFTTAWAAVVLTTAAPAAAQLALADVDRDGYPDLAAILGGAPGAALAWRNPGDPFSAAWDQAIGIGACGGAGQSLHAFDADQDGALDLAAGCGTGVSIWRNPLGPGAPFTTSWSVSATIAAAGSVTALADGDLDWDGYPELIGAVGGAAPALQVWRSQRAPFSGAWIAHPAGSAAGGTRHIAVDDFDLDGDADALAGGNASLDFWTNTLLHRASVVDGIGLAINALNAKTMLTGDLDRDGYADVVTYQGAIIAAWRRAGSVFGTPWVSTTVGVCGSCILSALEDLDGDGYLDLVVAKDFGLAQFQIWRNPRAPFDHPWTTHRVLTTPAQLTGAAVGDLDGDGAPEIIVAVGGGETFSPTVRIWRAMGDPFTAEWMTSTVGAISYTVNTMRIGDLDRDGWPDIVAGTNRAPAVGSEEEPVPRPEWPDAYQLVAFRSSGAPFAGGWSAFSLGRAPSDEFLARGFYKGYWGAHIYSLELADFDNDGDLDIASGGELAADYQLIVWENDGTPFDGVLWRLTTVALGAQWLTHGFPWLRGEVLSVRALDMNGDGLTDLVSTQSLNEPIQLNYWENTGAPFRPLTTDTQWLHHPIAPVGDYEVVANVADFDRDGAADIATVNPCCYGGYTVRLWRNATGAIGIPVTPTSVTRVTPGSWQALLRAEVSHLGRRADHAAEPAWWRLSLRDGLGMPLDAIQAQALFARFSVHADTGDGWRDEAPEETLVASVDVNTATVSAGGQITLTFAPGQPLAAVSPTAAITLYIAAQLQPAIGGIDAFQIAFDPDADSVARDRVNGSSAAILDTSPVTAAVAVYYPLTGTLRAIDDGPTVLGTATAFTATVLSGTTPSYAWAFGDGATAGGITASHVYASIGSYTAVVTAVNPVSVITATTVVSVDVPLAGLTAGNTGPAQLGSASVFTSALAAGSRAVYEWNFGDGAFGDGASPAHAYGAIGEYHVVVTAFNALGAIIATTMAVVVDAPVDGLAAESDSPTEIGEATTFTATISGGTNVVYAWSFGDGAAGAGPAAQHLYGAVGVYTAVVTASNSVNAITAAAVVAVLPGAPAVLTLEAAPPVQAAGALITVTAAVSDRFGNPVADGTPVSFSASLGQVDTPSVTARGVATTSLRSTLAATGLISGVSGLAAGTAVVTYTPATPIITVTTAASALAAASSSAVVVSVTDRFDNPWRGMPLSALIDPPALGTLSGISQTDKQGLARGQWVAGRRTGAGSLIVGNGQLTASVPISVYTRTYLPVAVDRPGEWRARVPLVTAPDAELGRAAVTVP